MAISYKTKLTTDNGAEINIHDIKVGDNVLGSDVDGSTVLTKVLNIQKEKGDIELISINDRLFLTKDHVIFTTVGQKKASKLQKEDTLIRPGGLPLVVKSLTRVIKEEVYDITTSIHTYFANGILVHNQAPPLGPPPSPLISSATFLTNYGII